MGSTRDHTSCNVLVIKDTSVSLYASLVFKLDYVLLRKCVLEVVVVFASIPRT